MASCDYAHTGSTSVAPETRCRQTFMAGLDEHRCLLPDGHTGNHAYVIGALDATSTVAPLRGSLTSHCA
jgi:hypothetical protein